MKLYIEDLIIELAGPKIQVGTSDNSVVVSLAMNPALGKGYTEKQRSLVLRLCKKYRNQLLMVLGAGVTDAIDFPEFKFNLIGAAPTEKSIKLHEKQIHLKFPFNEELVTKIRKFKETGQSKFVNWDPELKAWIFDLEEKNVHWLGTNFANTNFEIDEQISEYFEEISVIIDNFEEFMPTLVMDGDQFKFRNVHKSVPQPDVSDVAEAVLLAKQYGISAWDEKVAKLLETRQISSVFKRFLNETTPLSLEFDTNDTSIDQFTDLIKYNSPTLIIVPSNRELEYLRDWTNWLKTENIDEKDISVMFRLDNSTSKIFNDFVKDNHLNNPIGENTKIVFVSQKLPKPLIKSGIEFKLIINLGALNGVHYSLTNYLAERMDVVRYEDKKKIGYQFGLL